MKVAVIPARGGSQRIPHKNIRNFHGKPIITYSIEAALESRLFDRIIVSTDDWKIADIAISNGAEVPFIRPDKLADSVTSTSAVVKHALHWFQEHDAAVEYVCCIYATAPFLTVDDLREGYRLLQQNDRHYAFAVTSFPFPVQRSIRMTKDGGVEPMFPQYIAWRSQDLEEAYHDAGQFYWGRAEAFLNNIELFSHASIPVVLPRHRVQDIDTPEDWLHAEQMFRSLMEIGNA